MNFKSNILKLSVVLMLILVLIPVAAAMDSDDAFYEEYDYEDYEEVIVEYDSCEVEDTQIEASSPSYSESHEDLETNDDHYIEPVSEDEDAVVSPELQENSDFVTHNIDYVSDQIDDNIVVLEIFEDNIIDNVNETSDDELTLDDISVDVQGSIHISKVDLTATVIIIDELFKNEITTLSPTTTCFNKSLFKVMELKNILLINQEIEDYSDYSIKDQSIMIQACINKITNDYAYSIDNSISGGDVFYLVIFNKSTFLNLHPCFDATFSRDFLPVEYFSCGDYMIAAGIFVNYNFVEYISNPHIIEWIVIKNLTLSELNLI